MLHNSCMKLLRVNIVIMLCAVFLMRMLFADINLLAASSATSPSQKLFSACASLQAIQPKEHKEFSNTEQKQETFFEICEEDTDSDDDELIKDHPFLFAYVYSLVNSNNQQQLTKAACPGNLLSITSSDHCILFQVFRI